MEITATNDDGDEYHNDNVMAGNDHDENHDMMTSTDDDGGR